MKKEKQPSKIIKLIHKELTIEQLMMIKGGYVKEHDIVSTEADVISTYSDGAPPPDR